MIRVTSIVSSLPIHADSPAVIGALNASRGVAGEISTQCGVLVVNEQILLHLLSPLAWSILFVLINVALIKVTVKHAAHKAAAKLDNDAHKVDADAHEIEHLAEHA